MIIEQVLNNSEVLSTTESAPKAMSVSADASKMFFRMYIKNTYSNPIGSVVREITSNCFDSHIEAKVNQPIIIRKGEDANTKMQYISFIDFGMGLSPQRMDDVYTVLMTSTKRDTNDQIGGFGLGSKTPLAYNRQLAFGAGESDNSFFVITNFEGIKYTYLVYEGKESPMLNLMSQEETDEHNGTEIRVPILGSDLYKFENEIVRQLYYFDSIIFENFDNYKILNDYQILRAKNFLYRGGDYSEFMHISLGKVSYPINYDVVGLDKYDYQFPVALNFEIGEINVVTSREAIDYSDATIKLIKRKLNEAKAELVEMLTRQHDNVVTLEDFIKFRQNYKHLTLIEGKSITFNKLEADSIKLKNFLYKDLEKIPQSKTLFDILYRTHAYTSDKRKSRRNRIEEFNGDYFKLSSVTNAYIWDGYELAEKRNQKLGYLKEKHGVFHLLTKKKVSLEAIKLNFQLQISDLATFDKDEKVTGNSALYDTILDLFNEYYKIVESKFKKYEDFEVPQSYLDSIKVKRNYVKGNMVINIVTPNGNVNRETIQLKDLAQFKGTIVYGNPDETNKVQNASCAFHTLFSKTSGTESVKTKQYNGFKSESHSPSQHKKVLFIYVAKGNIKKLVNIEDTVHVSEMYNRFFYRKEDKVFLGRYLADLKDRFNKLESFYLSSDLEMIYPTLAEHVKTIRAVLSMNYNLTRLDESKYIYNQYFDFSKFKMGAEHKKLEKMLKHLNYINELNSEVLPCFRITNMRENPTLVGLMKNSLVSEKM